MIAWHYPLILSVKTVRVLRLGVPFLETSSDSAQISTFRCTFPFLARRPSHGQSTPGLGTGVPQAGTGGDWGLQSRPAGWDCRGLRDWSKEADYGTVSGLK